MAIGKNIRFHRKTRLDLTLEELEERSGVDKGTINALENRDSNMSKFFSDIAKALGLTLDELQIDPENWQNYQDNKSLSKFEVPPNSYLVDDSKLAHPPVYGKAMGGLPDRMFTDEGRLSNGHDEYAEVYSSDSNAFITRVDGNSMIPKYYNGGFALVEPSTDPEIEDDVLIKLKSGQVMLKKLVSRRGGVVLSSYNDPVIHSFSNDEIIWMYYVAYPVPARKIKSRI